MNLEELQDKIENIMTLMPPEMKVEWWIDNDLLPEKVWGTRKWSKEHPFKKCPSCEEELHITEYNTRPRRSKKAGELNIMSLCKKCSLKPEDVTTGIPRQKIYQGNAEERGYNIKMAVMEYFGNECNDCGFRGQMCQFDFDHLDPLTKEFGLGMSILPHSDPIDIIDEVTKVQMLCSNCHRKHSVRHERQNLPNRYAGTASTTLERMAEPVKDREHLRRDSP